MGNFIIENHTQYYFNAASVEHNTLLINMILYKVTFNIIVLCLAVL